MRNESFNIYIGTQ